MLVFPLFAFFTRFVSACCCAARQKHTPQAHTTLVSAAVFACFLLLSARTVVYASRARHIFSFPLSLSHHPP
jgi:hypothetical protein